MEVTCRVFSGGVGGGGGGGEARTSGESEKEERGSGAVGLGGRRGQSSLGPGEPELWSTGHTDQGGSARPKSPECMGPQTIIFASPSAKII